MATTTSAGHISSRDYPPSSQSSSGNLSSGKIAAIVIGTIIAVGVVSLLLFYPPFFLAWLRKKRRQKRPSGRKEVSKKNLPTQRPGRTSITGRRSNGAGSRRRRPDIVNGGNTQPHRGNGMTSRPSGAPVIINNNIYVNSTDYSQQHPAPNSPRTRDPAPPVLGVSRNPRDDSRMRVVNLGPPPNGRIPPLRRRNESPVSPPRVPRTEQTETSNFWDVADWARGVAPGPRRRVASPYRVQHPIPRREGSYTRERRFDIPGAFPDDGVVVERFRLVTAPARTRVPAIPIYGDDGFWVRETRNYWGGRQGRDNGCDRWGRCRREERGECDRLERQNRYERRQREERFRGSLWSDSR